MKLFMLLLGCKPEGRYTEQHDIFFGAGTGLKDLLREIRAFWPGPHKIHIDAWREVTEVNGYSIELAPREHMENGNDQNDRLFFLNLGGYKEKEFEEYHYKMLAVAKEKGEAIRQAKESAFYKHTGFKGATSHIDDKYGVDVDDVYEIEEIFPVHVKEKYRIVISKAEETAKDQWHLGYTKLSSIEDTVV